MRHPGGTSRSRPSDRPAADGRYFEAQIEAVLGGLYGAAVRLVRDRHEAEDLVAETVAKAWQALATLKDRGMFRAWVFRILTNTAISAGRKRAARPRLASIDDTPAGADDRFSLFEELHEPLLFWGRSPEQDFLNKILRDDLERAVDALPDALRAVVVLADLESFSYLEIARMLEVPVGTVRSRLARGRARLQKALWRHGVECGLIGSEAQAKESNDA